MIEMLIGVVIGAFVTMTVPAIYEPLGLERHTPLREIDLKAQQNMERVTRRELERLYADTRRKFDSCAAYNRGRTENLDTTKAVIEK